MTPEVTDTVVNEIEEFQDHEMMHHSHFAINNHQELCKPWQYKAFEENENHFDDEQEIRPKDNDEWLFFSDQENILLNIYYAKYEG